MKQFDDSLLDAALERYHFDRETGHFFVIVRDISGEPIRTGQFAGTVTPVGIRLTTKLRHVMAHHLAWRIYKGAWPMANIKHRDGDVMNCKEDNLYSPGVEAAKKAEKKRNDQTMLKFYKSIGVTDNQLKRVQVEKVRKKLGDFDALDMEYRLGLIDKARYAEALDQMKTRDNP
jgi:hypothetical protein